MEILAINAMLESFSDSDDINVLKTVLLATKAFKYETLLKHEIERLTLAYNKKYNELP